MKILAFSDLHFKNTGSQEQVSGHLEACKNTAFWIRDMILKHKPDYVVNLGDTNDKHGYVDIFTLEALIHTMQEIASSCAMVNATYVWMAGNHDRPSKAEGHRGVLEILSAGHWQEHLHLVDRHLKLNHTDEHGKETRLGFIAASVSREKFEEYLIPMADVDVLFIHECVLGAQLSTSYAAPDGIPVESLPGDIVMCGDIHQPQKIQNLTIVGAGGYYNFSDWYDPDNPRGCLILDTQDLTVQRLRNPETPVYHTVNWPEEREDLGPFLEDVPVEKRALRVKCASSGIEDMMTHFPDHEQYYRFSVIPTDTKDQPLLRSEEKELSSPEQVVREYCKQAHTELDKERLVNMGLEIVKACM